MAEENPWRRRSRHVAYENPWLTVWHDEVVRPDGEPGIYGVVHFRHLAVGVAVLDERDRVLLVGQYRYVLDRYSWEIPEGGGRFGEDPRDEAERELREETGMSATGWRELARVDLSNSITDEEAVLFTAVSGTEGVATPEGTERLEVRWVPFGEAVAMCREGRIRDAMTVIALLALASERAGRPASPP
jgi:8-oxo-dGTP pyrophosphatase MutT (NUDIX family)